MDRRWKLRMISCAALACLAAAAAGVTVSGFTHRQAAEFQGYVLGEAEGRVAVYDTQDLKRPLTVTDIELDSLRESDRALLRTGIRTGTAEELALLLEDLGS
ncbi:MAG: hypothetical protein IJU29_05035 [Oscillospiraceae bacterium]|nr:hypothetical protein [Oscillospiraceae bacterium]